MAKVASKGDFASAPKTERVEHLVIAPPNFKVAAFRIRGTTPLVIHAFPQKAKEQIHATQEAGSTAKKGRKREAKDFQACYEAAKHVSSDGWCGIHAAAFRNACISACKLSGFAMTRAKISIRCLEDGWSKDGATPLVKITKGEPQYREDAVRNADKSCDLRARPMWLPGWEAAVRLSFDADQFTLPDVANLMMRVGMQIGICEGRADSPKSNGCGWGYFALVEESAT